MKPTLRTILSSAIVLGACSQPSTAPEPGVDAGTPMREMRGVWVATVRNIDWPSTAGLSQEQQKAELIDIFDRAREARFNAIVLQVRPNADAVYRSSLEPWSVLLTGQQGVDPGYDPLEFAVAEAHERGLELHAWINPFRAGNSPDTVRFAPNHVWNASRNLVRVYGQGLWLDPGEPEAREHSLRVVADIVRRYDVDGIHMDDYFYPYPVRDSASGGNAVFPDSASYARSGSALSRDDWRRQNIDLFVERMYREAHEIRPSIKVGISPFGIWRPGNPPSVQGFDAYAQIYADARKWLREGWVDYFVPQLYWAISAPQQSFPALLDWWIGENVKGRHIWPGLATYRAGSGQSNGFALTEIAEQIRIIRSRPGAPGHIGFNGTTTLKRANFLETLEPLFSRPAVMPAYPWLDNIPLASPEIAVSGQTVTMTPGDSERPRWWMVTASREGGFFRRDRTETRMVFGTESSATFGFDPDNVVVRAVDGAGNHSPTTTWRIIRD